jgi:hypothetical protein
MLGILPFIIAGLVIGGGFLFAAWVLARTMPGKPLWQQIALGMAVAIAVIGFLCTGGCSVAFLVQAVSGGLRLAG